MKNYLLGTRRSLVLVINAFLERNQLLRPKCLIVDLSSCFNEVLQVCSKIGLVHLVTCLSL